MGRLDPVARGTSALCVSLHSRADWKGPNEAQIYDDVSGNGLRFPRLALCEVPKWGPGMSQAQTFYEGHSLYGGLTWSSVRELIGQGLRERYQVPTELPAKLLALLRKLEAIESKSLRGRSVIGKFDAIEGNYLLRHAPPLEPRSVGLSDDWLLCT